jgi:alkyl hydroperoxide reductase subunit AhpC
MEPAFLANKCKMIALSCDSMAEHNIWIKDVETISESPVIFPIIADNDRKVSKALKMDYDRLLGDDSKPKTSRVGYIVSPHKEVVYISIVPWTVGRSFTEFLRILKALQLTFHHPVATPAEWVPGDKVFLTDDGKKIPEYNTMVQNCLGLPSGRDYITLIDDPQAARIDASARANAAELTILGGSRTIITEMEAGVKAAASSEGKE